MAAILVNKWQRKKKKEVEGNSDTVLVYEKHLFKSVYHHGIIDRHVMCEKYLSDLYLTIVGSNSGGM